MANVENLLIESGFHLSDKKRKTYSQEIQEGYVLDFEPELGNWRDVDSLVITLKSKKFGVFMERLFNNTDACDYSERMQLSNSDGCLGMATVIVEYDHEPSLFTANGEILIGDFLDRLSSVKNVQDIYNIFYFEKTNKLLAMIEGVWVQLFFMLESNIDVEKIEEQLRELPSDFAKPEKKSFDLKSIHTFEGEYKGLVN
ncbi:hypothetical protein A6F57_16365 [Alteromonas stellipolaris]|uniref:hypothetical protein n=1 Tax=Alteromonas TaxID=226 RepID=UPI0007B4558F|nr:hypothetical protein [Alteromonas stellipolaris]ANB26620.1 hypothetical protein A6F57_16365 [Alteromonas stellipolaris]